MDHVYDGVQLVPIPKFAVKVQKGHVSYSLNNFCVTLFKGNSSTDPLLSNIIPAFLSQQQETHTQTSFSPKDTSPVPVLSNSWKATMKRASGVFNGRLKLVLTQKHYCQLKPLPYLADKQLLWQEAAVYSKHF